MYQMDSGLLSPPLGSHKRLPREVTVEPVEMGSRDLKMLAGEGQREKG
jgi:hypothetical protein